MSKPGGRRRPPRLLVGRAPKDSPSETFCGLKCARSNQPAGCLRCRQAAQRGRAVFAIPAPGRARPFLNGLLTGHAHGAPRLPLPRGRATMSYSLAEAAAACLDKSSVQSELHRVFPPAARVDAGGHAYGADRGDRTSAQARALVVAAACRISPSTRGWLFARRSAWPPPRRTRRR